MIGVGLALVRQVGIAAGSAAGAALWTWAGPSALRTGAPATLALIILCVVLVSRSGVREKTYQ